MLFTQGKRYGLDSMGKIKRGEMYSKLVKPNFDKIKKHLKHGATESQIADDIGVSLSSWNRFKRIHPEFNDLCNRAPAPRFRQHLCSDHIRRSAEEVRP